MSVSPLENTVKLQNSASDPNNCVFVSASAGSGKTKVLTDRVLRLLLNGVNPAAILCLTFTKIAATQMQKRIFARLQEWLLADEKNLQEELSNLIGKKANKTTILQARKLFAKLLDDDIGLQISTIHSFCQNIIKKFPIEAKISPNFTVIDEQKENQLLFEARKKLLIIAATDKKLAQEISIITNNLDESRFLDITSQIIKKRQNFAWLKEKYLNIENIIAAIYQQLNLPLNDDEEKLFNNFINDENWPKTQLKAICENSEIKSKNAILEFINQADQINFKDYLAVFLTKENQPKKQLTTKKIREEIDFAEEILRAEQERIIKFNEKFNNAKIARCTAALLIVVDKIIDFYHLLKSQNGYLDYSDLIIKTSQLLGNSDNKEWIKYKLDNAYEHILIDESQDTNHHQWDIIKAISEEFFVGETVNQKERTIFVVGDEKQSIYSFQGADPDIFANIFYYYQEKLNLVGKQFLNIEINNSFRSFPAILKAVDALFDDEQYRSCISNLSGKIKHRAIKDHHYGKVELLPAINIVKKTQEKDDEYQWNLNFDINEEQKAQEKIAQIIAKKISNFFKENKFLASKNRPIQYQDVMILLKERKSNLGNLLVKYLQKEQIPVLARDRIDINKDIIIRDLISAAQFILLPSDDFNLACLLKSPFFNIDEEELLAFCKIKNQQKISLFAAIKEQNLPIYNFLQDLINQNSIKQFSIDQFFSYLLIEKNTINLFTKIFGIDAQIIIDQFFKICLNYQNNNLAISLEHFIDFLKKSDLQIKIDIGNNHNQVRILTIHGAKGLEAPIVFLADSLHSAQKQFGNDKKSIFWDDGLPFWSIGKNFDGQKISLLKQKNKLEMKKEYWRQLYVAMTRAEEELYICGFGDDKNNDCWYSAIKNSIANFAKKQKCDFNQLLENEELQDDLIGESLIIGENFENKDYEKQIKSKEEKTVIPSFLKQAAINKENEELIYPSIANQKSITTNKAAYLGQITHKILEFLPKLKDQTHSQKEDFVKKYLNNQNIINDLSKAEKENIWQKINKILNNPDILNLINHPNAKSEVPIIAKNGNKTISGKIDLLVIKTDEIIIIDYKTGQKNPNLVDQYQKQMKIYEDVIAKIYPNKKVISKIIWVG